jgi:hypothetical protein
VALETSRPAFYALRSGGWRDYVTLLHPPYTAWHLSYVALGAALTPAFAWSRLLPTMAAFFLAVGIGAHALDELNGRPLRTEIPRSVLLGLATVSITGAVGIGVAGAVVVDPWIGLFVAAGAFIVVAYNLESFGGIFHSDLWFALAWGAFPVLTAYVGAAGTVRPEALLAAAAAGFLSLAQRQLSTQVRSIRRRTERVSGSITSTDGREEPITRESLIRAPEAALQALGWAVIAFALALLVFRLR